MTDARELLSRMRKDLGDPLQPFRSDARGDGQNYEFDLPKQQIIPGSETVQVVNGASITQLLSPSGYEMNYELGFIMTKQPVPNGALLLVSGECWAMFSDEHLLRYIRDAANEHLFNRTVTERRRDRYGRIVFRKTAMTIETLPDVETPLLATLATIHALWTMATDAASDASINTAEGTSIDRATRYQQVMNQIEAMTARYEEFCGQLNVGVFRAETLQLRRTSQTTGKLVSVFRPREYDDWDYPVRELPPIDERNTDNSGVPSQFWNGWGP